MLELKNITKEYGKNKILNNINLTISPNEIIGLLSPNGEGKTTLMKIIGGIITKYSGEVLLNNEKINYKSKNKIVYMRDRGIFPLKWSVEDTVNYYNKYFRNYKIDNTLKILDEFNISRRSSIGSLSLGQEEKVSLALTLGVDADIFMLDEPLANIDVIAREDILKTIVTEFKEGSTMIISTHLIGDIENIFDRVLFLKKGQIIQNKLVDDIREEGKSVVEFYKEVYRYEI